MAFKVDSGRVRGADGQSHIPFGLIRSLNEVKAEQMQAGIEDGVPQPPAWRNENKTVPEFSF